MDVIEEDEYERWKCSKPCLEKGSNHANNPIRYWVKLRNRYPYLSKLALNVLSIPASKCERLFSELVNLLEPRQRAIKPQPLAALQCVRRWQKAGLGDVEVAAKVGITNNEMELLYDFES
jgi:hypothetical protein